MPSCAELQKERKRAARAAKRDAGLVGPPGRRPKNAIRSSDGTHWVDEITHAPINIGGRKQARNNACRHKHTTRDARAGAVLCASCGAVHRPIDPEVQCHASSIRVPARVDDGPRDAEDTPPWCTYFRKQDATFACELIGLTVQVPWSAWGGKYTGSTEYIAGIVWEYVWQEKKFTIKFDPTLLPDDPEASEPISLNWDQLLQQQKCMDTARPRFLDRMPCRVRADGTRLDGDLAPFRFYTDRGRRQGGLLWDAAADNPVQPSDELLSRYHQIAAESNVTCFSRDEALHPINFYEQSDVCAKCGCQRFRTSNPSLCCQHGALRFNHELCNSMPDPLLKVITVRVVAVDARTEQLVRFSERIAFDRSE